MPDLPLQRAPTKMPVCLSACRASISPRRTGVAGLAAAVAGATRCVLTDREEAMPHLRANIASNAAALSGADVSACVLEWGDDAAAYAAAPDGADLILAADVLYSAEESVHCALRATLAALAGPRGATILHAYEERDSGSSVWPASLCSPTTKLVKAPPAVWSLSTDCAHRFDPRGRQSSSSGAMACDGRPPRLTTTQGGARRRARFCVWWASACWMAAARGLCSRSSRWRTTPMPRGEGGATHEAVYSCMTAV